MEAVKATPLLAHGRLWMTCRGRNDGLQRLSLRAEGTMIGETKAGWSRMIAAGGLLVAASLASGCSDSPPTGPPPTYTVGGTVSGLAGSGLVLRDNGGDDLPVSADGAFAFATELAGGAAYTVTVFTQPSSPAQHCIVTTGSGTMASANVTTVAIVCTTTTYTVGGTVTGLVGSGLVLRNNGGDDLSVTANGPVVFATPHSSGDSLQCHRSHPADEPGPDLPRHRRQRASPVPTSRPSPSFASRMPAWVPFG